MLNLEQIAALRMAVRAAGEDGRQVFWLNGDGEAFTVVSVPDHEMDPDDTGVLDFIAILARDGLNVGHVDLSNADPSDFVLAKPIFAPEPAPVLGM